MKKFTVRKHNAKVKGTTYTYWQVDCGEIDGRRVRVSTDPSTKRPFASKAAAETYAAGEREKMATLTRKIGGLSKGLSPEALIDCVQARSLLDGHASLSDAAQFYVDHHGLDTEPMTVRELYEEYLQSRIDNGRRPGTIKDIECRLGRFADDFEECLASSVSVRDLEKWIKQRGGTLVSRRNFRTHLSGLFNYALKRKYVRENPASAIELPTVKKPKPYVMPVEDVRKLMSATQKDEPDMIPYFAICIFAGIRPTEVQRLAWKDINLEDQEIFIDAEVSKTHDDRWVHIESNLLAWLTPFDREDGCVHFSRPEFDRARNKAKVRWKSDCMRHSYGSYHLAMYEEAGKTALQMGHRNLGTLFNHYRRAVKKEDAKKFWAIRPSRGPKIIKMPAAG